MKEHPILFSAPMVRALLADRKFITRRLSPQWMQVKAGDRLWVRETLEVVPNWGSLAYAADQTGTFIYYPDRGDPRDEVAERLIDRYGDDYFANETRKVPSIFMPRKYSRILLECEEDTRQERLLEITEEDAIAEGVETIATCHCCACHGNFLDSRVVFRKSGADVCPLCRAENHTCVWDGEFECGFLDGGCVAPPSPFETFEMLWQSLHTKPGERWEDNPEVVRVGRFRRVGAERIAV